MKAQPARSEAAPSPSQKLPRARWPRKNLLALACGYLFVCFVFGHVGDRVQATALAFEADAVRDDPDVT